MKLLGVTIQNDLKWNLHITEIVSKASRRLYTLCIHKKAKVPITDIYSQYLFATLDQFWSMLAMCATHQLVWIKPTQ